VLNRNAFEGLLALVRAQLKGSRTGVDLVPNARRRDLRLCAFRSSRLSTWPWRTTSRDTRDVPPRAATPSGVQQACGMVVEAAINPICDQSRDGGRVSVSRGKPLGEEGRAARGRQSRPEGVTKKLPARRCVPSPPIRGTERLFWPERRPQTRSMCLARPRSCDGATLPAWSASPTRSDPSGSMTASTERSASSRSTR
jgi:hypothetical protein